VLSSLNEKSMRLNIWLVRHAHRLDFVQPEWFETAPLPYDPPLSALGWQQSLELVAKLQNSHIQKIFTSPYLRTIQTAYPIAQSLGLSIQVEEGLREWLHPEWSLSLPETLPIEILEMQGLPIDLGYQSQVSPTYSETIDQLLARANVVIRNIIHLSQYSVLIVAHKHVLLGMVAALTGRAAMVQESEFAAAAVLVLTAPQCVGEPWEIVPLDSFGNLT
jgi:broad specificity phosphatase PhoE